MSPRDLALTSALVLGFAALVTAHLTIVAGLMRRGPVWRALVALVALPLAPVDALRAGMRVRGIAWLTAFAVYVAAFAVSLASA